MLDQAVPYVLYRSSARYGTLYYVCRGEKGTEQSRAEQSRAEFFFLPSGLIERNITMILPRVCIQ